jgi:Salmonella virulence plasmid 65kDa B protein
MDLPITNATESKTRRLRRISSLRLLSALQALAVSTLGEPSFAADPPNGLSGSFGESAGSAQVVLSSGAMTYGVPFVLPRGRGNAQPSLAIQYRSGAPSGEAGLGWSLNLPQIERAPLSGWPKYIDDGNPMTEDRYAFNGQPLTFVCVVGGTPACPMNEQVGPMPTWAEGFRHYRLQVEGSFERFFLSPDRRTWMVQRRGGEIMEFGAPARAPILPAPRSTSNGVPGHSGGIWFVNTICMEHATSSCIAGMRKVRNASTCGTFSTRRPPRRVASRPPTRSRITSRCHGKRRRTRNRNTLTRTSDGTSCGCAGSP